MKTLYKTLATVTILSICERFLGFLYKIILSRTLGSEGVGIYQIALSVFAVLVTFTSSGIPITVSRLMQKYKASGNFKSESSVATAGIIFSLLFSVPICIILFVFQKQFALIFADERCIFIFTVMLPGLIFTSVYAVIRGIFWGNRDFLSYSIIELLEELCMILVGVFLVSRASSVFDGAQKAAFAIVVSYVLSFSLSVIIFVSKGGKLSAPKGHFKVLISSAMPITGMKTSNSLINSFIAILLPLRLIKGGFTTTEALSEFGIAFGMSIPLLFTPATIIGSLALVLVPELSENFYKNQHFTLKKNVEKAIKFSIIVSCLIIPVFFSLGDEIGLFIFNNEKSGKYLSASAVIMLPMCISMITTSMLNSLGKEKKTLVYFLIGAAAMMMSIYILPIYIKIYALLVGFFLSFLITSILNLRLIHKSCKEKPEYMRFFLLSVSFLIPSSALGFLIKNVFGFLLHPFFTIAIGCIAVFAFNLALYAVFDMLSLKGIIRKYIFKKDKI